MEIEPIKAVETDIITALVVQAYQSLSPFVMELAVVEVKCASGLK